MANCSICGGKIGFMDISADIKKGKICKNCLDSMGASSYSWMKNCTLDEVRTFAKIDKEIMDGVNYEVASVAKFDDADHLAYFLPNINHVAPAHEYTRFSYDQILGCEIVENGDSMSSNAFGAAVGGVLLGATGAIIGSAGGRDAVCNSLAVKITVNGYEQPAFYINAVTSPLAKNTAEYADAVRKAHDVAAKIDMIMREREKNAAPSMAAQIDPVAEIRRYKELADEGIITNEEFEAKKAQLLAL